MAFRREARVARGGPAGGDGGRGGDVWLVADRNVASLLAFRDHPHRRAGSGRHGSGNKRHGARGADLEVPVPVGTVVLDHDTGQPLADLSGPGDRWLAARAGEGGRGNSRFLTQPPPGPRLRRAGRAGGGPVAAAGAEADGRRGHRRAAQRGASPPSSAGCRRPSPRSPTTRSPPWSRTWGWSAPATPRWSWPTCPAWSKGLARAGGLGHRFLRHIERARVLLVMLDLAPAPAPPPAEQQAVLLRELERYRPDLLDRPRLVVGSRADLAPVDIGHESRAGRDERRKRPPSTAGG